MAWHKSGLKATLSGRSQVVELQCTRDGITCQKSCLSKLTREVPQGSILGPIEFILLTNDFSEQIENDNSIALTYADDTTIVVKDKTAEGIHLKSISFLNYKS